MYLQYTNIIFYTIEKLAICRFRRCLSVIKMSVLQYVQIINRLMGITGVVPPSIPAVAGRPVCRSPASGGPILQGEDLFLESQSKKRQKC